MKSTLVRLGLAALMIATLAGCGGGGSDEVAATTPPPVVTPPPPVVTVASAVSSAAAVAANDTASNSSAPFTVLQNAGLPAVTVNSPPKVNFTVFSDGAVKLGLTTSNVSFAIAKLVPGTNGNPDQWVSYIYRTRAAATGTSPFPAVQATFTNPAKPDAVQANTDTKAATQLVYNPDGYYTYTFSTDIKDPAKTNGVVFEPNLTHRVAIQLSYTNKAGATVVVNPYFDFTVDANGNAVAVTDASKTRKMTDVATCNGCHNKLVLHSGGRVDTQYCVMCHNPGTSDANSGNIVTLSTMVHSIHAGRYLAERGVKYTVRSHDYTEVGFPQDVRNCATCHSAANASTPQGDNWKSKPSKEACLACHKSGGGSNWDSIHVATLKLGASVAATPNSTCASCHGAGTQWSSEQVHWVQEVQNARNYQSNIESVTLKTAPTATTAGVLTVKYSVTNPVTGAAYDMREGCTGAATKDDAGNSIPSCNTNYRWSAVLPPAVPGKPQDKFGVFTLYAGTNVFTQTTDDTTSNTGSRAGTLGVDDGTHHYTIDLTIAKGSHGNARVMMLGSVAETRLDPISRAKVGAVPPVANSDLAYVPVKNAVYEFDLDSGKLSTNPRRKIVSNDKCNVCHGILGAIASSEPSKPAFHSGHRNNSETCEICHNANQAGSYTYMTDGSGFQESYQARRFIHGIHGNSKRTYPFTHCNNGINTGEIGKDGLRISDKAPLTCTNYPGAPLNFAAEVAYPGTLQDCNTCHVNDSWKKDKAVLGAVISKKDGANNTGNAVTDPQLWKVITPKAAACTSCHDSTNAKTHVTSVGGASFGNITQGDFLAGKAFESCDGCHAPVTGFKAVDTIHARR